MLCVLLIAATAFLAAVMLESLKVDGFMCNGSVGSPGNFPGFLIRLPPRRTAGVQYGLMGQSRLVCFIECLYD